MLQKAPCNATWIILTTNGKLLKTVETVTYLEMSTIAILRCLIDHAEILIKELVDSLH